MEANIWSGSVKRSPGDKLSSQTHSMEPAVALKCPQHGLGQVKCLSAARSPPVSDGSCLGCVLGSCPLNLMSS